MQDLPLNGRNFVQLATLAPGVSGAGSGMRGTIMSGTRPDDLRPGTELFVNGNRENSNNYLYDGIDNNTRLTLVIVMRPNVEAIKEFKVQTNLYSAEQGRNPGGQVNVVTKSGGNTIHGVGLRVPARRQLRRQQLLRQPRRAAQAAVQAAPVRRRASAGRSSRTGPSSSPTTTASGRTWAACSSTPCRPRRCGGATSASCRAPIYDPLTTVALARRDVHAPALPRQHHSAEPLGPGHGQADERLSAADLAGAVQQPGHDADAHAGLEPVRRARRSHAERERTTSSSATPGRRPRPPTRTPSPTCSSPACRRRSASATRTPSPAPSGLVAQHAVLGWVHVFSPRLVLDTRVGYNHFDLDFAQADVEVGRPARRAARRAQRQPAGRAERHPDLQPRRLHRASATAARCRSCATRRTFQYVANLTYAADKHTIKAGFDVRRRHMGEFQTNRGNGRFNFSLEHHQQPGEQHRRPRRWPRSCSARPA